MFRRRYVPSISAIQFLLSRRFHSERRNEPVPTSSNISAQETDEFAYQLRPD